ncbi:MAG: iron-containing alcohol dehydrogenase [Epulopiscium sp.]|nr:iron-containing alcohol dehydrogenase [Candidatus Epulonipiscium sp.]
MLKAKKYNLVETNLFGPGAIQFLPDEFKRRNYRRALIVTDPSLVKVGIVAKIEAILSQRKIMYTIFDQVCPNPTVAIVDQGLAQCQSMNADCIIAIGGGSPIDTSKAIGILATNGGTVQSYMGVNKSQRPALPIIAINTTAGTGSEVTTFYVITDDKTSSKMVAIDDNCTVRIAVNDPELMLSMPKTLTVTTGMDALTHAIEAYVSINANPLTDKDALWAIRTIHTYLPKAVECGEDIEARTMMAHASYIAGIAFSNAGLGMVHAMAHSLGGFYNLPHGLCNAILLPYVMEYNGREKEVQKRYKEVAAALGVATTPWMMPYKATMDAIMEVKKLSRRLGLNHRLSSLGVKESDFESLATLALSDTCMPTNPIQPSLQDIINVYKKAF